MPESAGARLRRIGAGWVGSSVCAAIPTRVCPQHLHGWPYPGRWWLAIGRGSGTNVSPFFQQRRKYGAKGVCYLLPLSRIMDFAKDPDQGEPSCCKRRLSSMIRGAV